VLASAHAVPFNPFVAALSTAIALLAIGLAWLLYGRKPLLENQPDPLARDLGPAFVGMQNKWWVDELYDFLVVRRYVWLAGFLANAVDWSFWHNWFHDRVIAQSFRDGTRWLADSFDMPVIDGASARLAEWTRSTAEGLRRLQTGRVRNYGIYILAGLVVMMGYFLLRSLS
jgi:NADH-quinone oxidoreductase subunit L